MGRARSSWWSWKVLGAVAAALLGVACGDDSDDGLVERKTPASIGTFSAEPSELEFPGTTTLTWETFDTVSVTILQNGEALESGEEELPTTGSVSVMVEETTTFQLIAAGRFGEPATKTAVVEILGLPPTIGSFSATEVVERGEDGGATTELSWEGVAGATEVFIEVQGGEDIPVPADSRPNGSTVFELDADTTFTLVASNPLGEERREATTRVIDPPSIELFAIDRSWVGISEPVEVSWETSGATRVELWIDGLRVEDLDDGEVSGTYEIAPSLDTELELRAWNELDTEVASETLVVKVGRPAIDFFEGSPMSRWLGEPLTLSWATQGGRQLVVDVDEEIICETDELPLVDASTCDWEIPANGTYTFTLTVSNSSGSISEAWTVEVGSGPVIHSFTARPLVASLGDPIELAWQTGPDPDEELPTLSLVDDHDNEYSVMESSGLLTITPEEPGPYEFTLTASTSSPLSRAVEATASVEIFPLPTVTLTATPNHFDEALSENVVFEWTSSAAVSLVLYRLDGTHLVELIEIPEAERASGSFPHLPADDASYRIVATNGAGATTEAEVTVTLAPPRVIAFSATPSETAASGSVVLDWETEMAHEVRIEPLGREYLAEETAERFIDLDTIGGTRVSVTGECGSGTQRATFCVTMPFPGGFTFPFDGQDYSELRIYTSGVVSFDLGPVPTSIHGNVAFPTPAGDKAFAHLAPFWDALSWDPDRYEFGNLSYLLREDPAGDSFVIQWKDVSLNGTTYYPFTSLNFQLVLWENGDFEFRYGTMESAPNYQDWADGGLATIGYQTPSRTSYAMLNFNQSLRVRGPLQNRAFRFKKAPALGKAGSLVWHPYTNTEELKLRLVASRGDKSATEEITLIVKPRPIVSINLRPTEPVVTGADFRIGWLTEFAEEVEVLNGSGDRICHTTAPATVTEGFCIVQETGHGEHVYRVRAIGAHGSTMEREFPLVAYDDFGIVYFETDEDSIESGQSVTLSWATLNAASISLEANGVELLPTGTVPTEGTLEVESLTVDTAFTLRVTNDLGLVHEETRHVEMWTIRFGVEPSAVDVRPGDTINVEIDIAALDGGPTPRVFGTFPLVEVTDPSAAYVDISTHPDATQLGVNPSASFARFLIPFPEGFTFPYFGEEVTQVTATLGGFISLLEEPMQTYSRSRLPSDTIPFDGVQFAPFWTDLHSRGQGEMWFAQTDPDTLVIQWSKLSVSTGSTNANPYNLNFQVALKRDGTFEYRYGAMTPPASTSSSCYPNTCVNEANGSIAVIGYQNRAANEGFTLHTGGPYASSPEARPFDGGLSNRTFRSQPLFGSGTVTITPTAPAEYVFCSTSGDRVVCKSFKVTTDFEIEEFTPSATKIDLGQSATLSWKTTGGKELTIRNGDEVVFQTTNLSEIDQGSFVVTPTVNANYVLELWSPGNFATEAVTVEVVRMEFTATTSNAAPFPGEPVTISWNLDVRDPTLVPHVVAPMEEVELSFYDLDLNTDPNAIVLINHNTNAQGNPVGNNTQNVRLDFDPDFTFPYFGTEMSWVRVTTEGYLSFVENTTATSANQLFPNSTATYQRINIAPFWEDMNTRLSGRVLAKRTDPDTYVIQWSRMSLNNGSADNNEGDLNFMVVLRRSGVFEFRFGQMLPQPTPATSTTACYPNTCVNETNGSSATIGYQVPGGTAGYTVYYGGTNRAATQLPVPGGLTNRAWRYTPRTASGSATVVPWNPTSLDVCVLDAFSKDVFCAETVEVDARWEISSFEASPTPVLRDHDVTLSWEVVGLDELRVLADGVEIATYNRATMPLNGVLTHRPNATTTYVLEGTSLGRELREERLVELRALNLHFAEPTGRLFPGDSISLPWTLEQLEPGPFAVTTGMIEIPAGPGEIGEYKDVRTEEGAVEAIWSAANGHATFDLPFDFPYFGKNYRQVQAYVDGYITFDPGTAAGRGTNQPFPTEDPADSRVHIAPFWEDHFRRGAALGLDTLWLHRPTEDSFIIQYTNFNRSGGSAAPDRLYDLNFQIVLYADGAFEFRYGKLAPPPQPFSNSSCYPDTCELEANGSSATIGYQTVDGSFGHNWHYGGQGAAGVVPVPGGLAHRTLRYQPTKSGTVDLTFEGTRDVTLCGSVGEFIECKTLFLQAVADPGDLMITELMIDPTGGPENQWFEVRNLSKRFIDLEGFDITTDTGTHKIGRSLVVAPGEYVTLAASAGVGFTPDYVYGTTTAMDKMVDTLSVRAGTAVIGSVSWGVTWNVPVGSTLYLDSSRQVHGTVSNDEFEHWCLGGAAGTPGVRGVGCTDDYYDVETHSTLPFIDISGVGTRHPDLENSFGVQELPIRNFLMPFYDGFMTSFWVSTTGFVSFASEYPSGSQSTSPFTVPRDLTVTPLGPLVFPYWDNLVCDPNRYPCSFHYHRGVFDEQEMLILQWTGYRRGTSATSAPVGSMTFQIQLWLDGTIVFAYADMESENRRGSTNWGYYHASMAWIGLEAPDSMNRKPLTISHRTVRDLSHRTIEFRLKE